MEVDRGGEQRGGGMANINRRNATANFDNAFRNVGARPGGALAAAVAAATEDDPFSRRKTRPMNYWNTKRAAGDTNSACPFWGGSMGYHGRILGYSHDHAM